MIGHLLRCRWKREAQRAIHPRERIAVEESVLAAEFSGFSKIKWSALTPTTERALSRKTLSFPLLPTQNDAVLKVLLIYIFMCYSRWPGRYIHFNIPIRKRTSLYSILPNPGKAVGLLKKDMEGVFCLGCDIWLLYLCHRPSKWACRTMAIFIWWWRRRGRWPAEGFNLGIPLSKLCPIFGPFFY